MSERWPEGRPAAVTVTFDGGYTASVHNAVPMLEARGLPSTWFLVADAVGASLEGREVADWSWWRHTNPEMIEVGNHSLTHPLVRRSAGTIARRMAQSPAALVRAARRAKHAGSRPGGADVPHRVSLYEAVDDFAAGKRELEEELGRAVPAFAYPNGRARRRLVRGVKHMGHRSGRTSAPGTNDPRHLDPFALRAQTWTVSTPSDAPAQWVDDACRRGGWLIEVFHLVDEPSGYPWTTTPADFARHLDALVDAGVWVAPQTAVLAHLTRTAVPDVGVGSR
jgi:peptidoglycan/xylan/chitin deacetylase (PgdA/CDA1 family)